MGGPILVSIVCAAEPVWRISHRPEEEPVQAARLIEGHGVELLWAPPGPGWPATGNASLAEAEDLAARLSEDGLTLAATPQNLWRLPTIEEIVRSATRFKQNAGGQWDAASGQAAYQVRPDKEPPLWNLYSPVIYWWSSSPARDGAYTYTYNGFVIPRSCSTNVGTLGFRAVRVPPKPETPTPSTSEEGPARQE